MRYSLVKSCGFHMSFLVFHLPHICMELADVFSKVTRNNMARFVCFTPHFPSNFKALPACRFRIVVKNKSRTVFCVPVLLLITDNAIKCSKLCSETTRYAIVWIFTVIQFVKNRMKCKLLSERPRDISLVSIAWLNLPWLLECEWRVSPLFTLLRDDKTLRFSNNI